MKPFLGCLIPVLLACAASAAVNARNGVSITTASTINGVTPNSAVNGQTVTAPSGAIAFVTAGTVFFGGLQGDITQPFTLSSAASNGYVVASIAYYDTLIVTFNAPTCDGVAMTLLSSHTSSGDALYKIAVYGLAIANKTAGTYDIFYDVTNNNYQSVFTGVSVYNNVNQGTSTGTAVAADGNSTTPSVTVSSATGELVVGAVASFDTSGNPAVGAGQTSRYAGFDGVGGNFGSSDEAGAASVTHSYTVSSGEWVIIGFPLKP
jgi:hypothetical protein